MKVSLNWIRYINDEYSCAAEPAPKGVDALVEKIGLQLGAVEEVIDLGKKYKGIVIVKVVSCAKHPNADKLSICLVDDNKSFKGVNRDKNGLVKVVCGAPNVKAGMLAAWVPPGSTVPSTYYKEPFVIEAREIRGVISNGMLASAKELDLGEDHTGIVELDEDAKPGADFAKTYGLDDYIIDIENKMFTHRPDCFGMLGVAREIAGIQGHKFKSPDWYREDAAVEKSRARDDHKLSFKNEVPKLVPRFSSVVIKDVDVRESRIHIKAKLVAVGVRPTNNIVDLTNIFMVETAQPLHAYDYDKVLALQNNQTTGVKMGTRLSKKGEQIKLLGGKQLKLDDGAVLITADDTPIGLGGVMGGADTEVDENTKNIILESANFDMNATRKTAMRYGLFTDAATRFTKGQSPLQTMTVLAKITENILNPKYSGGRVSAVVDNAQKNDLRFERTSIRTTAHFINSRLGLNLPPAKIQKILENVEFEVNQPAGSLVVTSPFWRTDIEIPEDIVEEVGRLYGYDHLPQKLPTKDLAAAKSNLLLELKSRIRNILAAAGVNELLTYSFVHGSLLDKAGQDKNLAYKISNTLSPELQYFRLSLSPSLLEKVHPNIKAGFDIFCMFEIGKAHQKEQLDKEKLPKEFERLSLVFAAKDSDQLSGAPFYQVKFYASHLLNKLGITVEFHPIKEKDLDKSWLQAYKAFEPGRTVGAYSGETLLGFIGEPSLSLRSALKLPKVAAQLELDVQKLLELSPPVTAYSPLLKFPSLDQDLCLKLPVKTSYVEATDFIYRFLDKASLDHGYRGELRPIDIYQKKSDQKHKQITWRIILSHAQRTLTTTEVNKLLDELSAKAKKDLRAERI